MSDLSKKVDEAIKILKMAERDAAEREDKLVKVQVFKTYAPPHNYLIFR